MTSTDSLRRALRAEDDIIRRAQEIIAEHITSDAPDRDTLNRLIEVLDGQAPMRRATLPRRRCGGDNRALRVEPLAS